MPGPGMELIGEEELAEVAEVIRSQYVFRYGDTHGSGADPRFLAKTVAVEQRFAELSDVHHALAVNSGTSALLAALAGLDIGGGDEVIVPGYTFVASMSSVVNSRAVPVLAEVDETFNLDPDDVRARITERTRAIMAVHMLGNPARLGELRDIADQHGLALIEDCAQACGATYRGAPVGSIGDAGTFSFNVYKVITCGEGGMVTTNDAEIYQRAFAFHDQGHSPLRTGIQVGERPFIGLDFRITELQAAMLNAQLDRLPSMLKRLRANKRRFKAMIERIEGLRFRHITDPDGECATILTVILPTPEIAQAVASDLSTSVVAQSSWHVYSNMEHLLQQQTATHEGCPFGCGVYSQRGGEVAYERGMLPRTDDLLNRSINIGIGIADPGLGAGFGVTINDDETVIDARAEEFRAAVGRHLA